MIVVDQLGYSYIERFEGLYEGGFRTLLDEGASFSNAKYRHGITVTAAGHATISTGKHPSHTGMVGNSWRGYDPAGEFANINCVADFAEDRTAIGGKGAVASPVNLLADSIGDLLKRQHQGSKVVSISWKDRAANLLAGREADAAFWYSKDCGCLITSNYFVDETPAWLAKFNDSGVIDKFGGRSWERRDAAIEVYEKNARADEFPGEPPEDASFPHAMPEAPELYGKINPTPFTDAALMEGAKAMIEAYELGADGETDILAIGLSGTDYIGHRWGPHSQEAMDAHLRLDSELGELFKFIDEKVGLDNAVIVLSADHGALPLVEFVDGAKRVSPKSLAGTVNKAVAAEFPDTGPVVASAGGGNIYFDLPGLEEAGVEIAKIVPIAKAALLESEDVAEVFTQEDLKSASGEGPYWQLFRNSFFERRSPHLMVRLKENYFPGGSSGTGHGSAYEYDRHVPLMLLGPGIKPGRYSDDAGPDEISPTLARLLGFEMSLEPGSRVLEEVLQ